MIIEKQKQQCLGAGSVTTHSPCTHKYKLRSVKQVKLGHRHLHSHSGQSFLVQVHSDCSDMNNVGKKSGSPDGGLNLVMLISHSLTDKLLSDHSHLFTLHCLQGLQPTRRFVLSAQKHPACVFQHTYQTITDMGLRAAAAMRTVILVRHAAARVQFTQLHHNITQSALMHHIYSL